MQNDSYCATLVTELGEAVAERMGRGVGLNAEVSCYTTVRGQTQLPVTGRSQSIGYVVTNHSLPNSNPASQASCSVSYTNGVVRIRS